MIRDLCEAPLPNQQPMEVIVRIKEDGRFIKEEYQYTNQTKIADLIIDILIAHPTCGNTHIIFKGKIVSSETLINTLIQQKDDFLVFIATKSHGPSIVPLPVCDATAESPSVEEKIGRPS